MIQGIPPLRHKLLGPSSHSRLSASFIEQPEHLTPWEGLETETVSHPSQHTPSATHDGGVAMEKQASATGAIAGIEWVDWYDCYKAYKAEKIRAEASAKEEGQQQSTPHSEPTSIAQSPVKETDASKRDTLSAGMEGLSLTPVTSRDDGAALHRSLSFRRQSLSNRSGMPATENKPPSLHKRAPTSDRPRQSSGGSSRSTSDTYQAAAKRKRNLVMKMEGWWSSVKSNFTEPTPPPRSSGIYSQPRLPSAPSSRRGSDKQTTLSQSLMPPAPVRRASSASGRSLRSSPSHQELRGSSAQPLPAQVPNAVPPLAPPPALARDRELGHIERITRSRPGLEVRRNQPSLRLDLEPHVLSSHGNQHTPNTPSSTHSQGSGSVSGSSHQRALHGGSRSSSYGFGVGSRLGSSVPSHLDPAMSPTLSKGASLPKGDRPVAPGADLTVASVREHVKQRVNAAKQQCDNTLRRVIHTITVYEDQRIASLDYDETRRDYFDTFSDSPTMDAVDSEDESTIPPIGGCKSWEKTCLLDSFITRAEPKGFNVAVFLRRHAESIPPCDNAFECSI